VETATFGSREYKEAQKKTVGYLEIALDAMDQAEKVLKTIDDPNINLDQTTLRMMDTRGRIASTLVFLKKKWTQ
jgi:hypothetical protein